MMDDGVESVQAMFQQEGTEGLAETAGSPDGTVGPTAPAVASGPAPEAGGGTVEAEHPTQVAHPWRAALRTGFVTLLAFLAAVAAASVFVAGFAEQYIKGSGAVVLAAGAFCGGLAAILNRLALLPAVNALFTGLGLGASPKN